MTIKHLALIMLATSAAFVVPFQAIVNSRLGVLTENRLLAAVISFSGGTLVLSLLMLINSRGLPTLPAGISIPWYLYVGGLLGSVYVLTALSLVPHIGTATFIAATIVGQLVMSIIIDHWGLLNVDRQPISLAKIAGVVLLVSGTLLIQMQPAVGPEPPHQEGDKLADPATPVPHGQS